MASHRRLFAPAPRRNNEPMSGMPAPIRERAPDREHLGRGWDGGSQSLFPRCSVAVSWRRTPASPLGVVGWGGGSGLTQTFLNFPRKVMCTLHYYLPTLYIVTLQNFIKCILTLVYTLYICIYFSIYSSIYSVYTMLRKSKVHKCK